MTELHCYWVTDNALMLGISVACEHLPRIRFLESRSLFLTARPVDFGLSRRLSYINRLSSLIPSLVKDAVKNPFVDFGLSKRLWNNNSQLHPYRRFGAMKYLLMCCTEEKNLAGLSKSEREALMQETSAYCEALHNNGHLIVAEALEPVEMATTVRIRNGTLSTTDGPFAETKEQFGGFFLINARDLNEAIQVASKFPSARVGSMEVRPVRELDRQ
jgi:hypothetical protein